MSITSNYKTMVAITDIDGILRGKYVSLEKLIKIKKGGAGFCSVIYGWDSQDQCYQNDRNINVKFTGWHTGYHDIIAKLDSSTSRKLVWNNNSLYLMDFPNSNVCPRNLLKKVVEQANQMGYNPKIAAEYEWFNFRENCHTLSAKNYDPTQLRPITEGNFGYSLLRLSQNDEYITKIYDSMNSSKIPIECFHTETGPGVLEVALKYCDALEMADRAVIFKHGVKEIASQFGIIPTFMAKWNENLPGSGCHIHQSLESNSNSNSNSNSKNVFYDNTTSNNANSDNVNSDSTDTTNLDNTPSDNTTSDNIHMSNTMKHYLAGQLHCLPYILPFFAPNVNSYKRLVDGYWAPTRVGWGIENRTGTHRIILDGSSGTRIECRVGGADLNPYLAISASIASGLYGIRNQLHLCEPFVGNAYQNDNLEILPNNLMSAIQKMETSSIAKELFGKEFVEHFIATRKWEWKQYNQSVTDWERKRYMEII